MDEKNVPELNPEVEERFKKFDPTKPLIINTTEISGFSHLSGRFVFKRPTLGDQLRIGVLAAKMKQNSEVDGISSNIAEILAAFEVVCIEKPKGFAGFEECYEFEPVFELYGRFLEYLNFFRLKLQKDKE